MTSVVCRPPSSVNFLILIFSSHIDKSNRRKLYMKHLRLKELNSSGTWNMVCDKENVIHMIQFSMETFWQTKLYHAQTFLFKYMINVKNWYKCCYQQLLLFNCYQYTYFCQYVKIINRFLFDMVIIVTSYSMPSPFLIYFVPLFLI